jgi:uncharacterized protein YsxB (DUF464 family)
MTKVTYYRDLNRIEVEGHAMSGEEGHDLVCASASILTYTLASFVRNTNKARQSKKIEIKLDAGNSIVGCKAKRDYKLAITLVFDAICGGFELLARNYPNNISYIIKA